MILLIDTFNNITISRHRTVLAAMRASRAHDRAVKRANGSDSYIPTDFRDSDGAEIAPDVIDECAKILEKESLR
jgi:hypothetical protein